MSKPLNIGIIGLGVMGQRMLASLVGHARLRPTLVWDANPAALQATLERYPELKAAASAEALLATPGLDSAYFATPPASHIPLANLAFDAGLAVLSEKPLTLDFDAGRRTVARIAAEGLRDGVNFSLASSPGLLALKAACAAGGASGLGTLQGVDIELSFAAWPRPWQSGAGPWLSEREEGGFSREVLSHFIYLLQHLLGPANVQSSSVSYPEGGRLAETALRAQLSAGGLPVTVDAAVRGEVADVNRFTLKGSQGAIRLHDWFGLSRQAAGQTDWQAIEQSPEARAQGGAARLNDWVALIEGRPHGLPRFAEALAVQETIEALLKTD